MDETGENIIVYVTVPLLLYKLQNLLNYQSIVSVREAIDQLEMISTRLRDIEKINLNISSELCTVFLRKLHEFEDVIDNRIGEIELQRGNDSLKIMSPLIFSRPQQDRFGLIREKLNSVTASAKYIMERENLRPRNLQYPVPDDSDFVGLNDKVDEAVKLLCNGEMPNAIAVTGERGSGKTFLTKTVYNATKVKRHFDGRAWVNFSKDFEPREFFIDILDRKSVV